jgi:hypothetical protein
MKIFELTAIYTPLAGGIAGGMAVKSPDIGSLTLGVGIGLAVGLALYFVAIRVVRLVIRFCTAEKLKQFQWLASLTVVLLLAASPFAAWALSTFVVSGVIRL